MTAPTQRVMMQRVMILGGSGSGKSTLARELGARLGVPAIHLDQLYHGPGWAPPVDDVFVRKVAAAAALPAWVIDGNYVSTAAPRIARADTMIYLDVPRWLAMTRVIRRLVTGYGRQRRDAAEGCAERFDPTFLRYVWHWERDRAPRVRALLDGFPGRAIVLRNKREVAAFLQTLASPKVRA